MNSQDDYDSRGSVGSLVQAEFDHASISEFEADFDEEYNDDGENSGGENECAALQSMTEPVSAELPMVLTLKETPERKSAATKNVPPAKIRKIDHFPQAIVSCLYEKKKATSVAKKRPVVEALVKNDYVEFGNKILVAKKKTVSIIKEPVEHESQLPIEELGRKPKAAVKNSRKIVATATHELTLGKGYQDPECHSEAVSSAQTTQKIPLTSLASEAQVHARPHQNSSRKNEKMSETPGNNSLVLNDECADHSFWIGVLANDFESLDYKALLTNSLFSEEQAYVLQQSFYQLCRKLSDFSTYNDRFMKTHKCLECEFSISHQCVSINFTQITSSGTNITDVTPITSQSTIMCMCQFSFFHSHATQTRIALVNNLNLRGSSRMLEHDRSVSVSCPKCHINVVIKNRKHDICCEFTNWNSLEGPNRRQFFRSLENRLQTARMSKPYLNELYACNRQCCQLFHRCAEDPMANDTSMPIRSLQ